MEYAKKEKRSARIEQITRQLTNCFSVSETAGEARMGDIIYAMLAENPYFQAHPENLRRLPIAGDPWGRISVLALMRGEKRPSSKTVVTIGHFDTVGISDYGALAPYANQPDLLRESCGRWNCRKMSAQIWNPVITCSVAAHSI